MEFKVSLCICTRNRPDDLRRALQSIKESRLPVHQVIVSDDSTAPDTCNMISSDFPEVIYVKGPQKGLSINRNNALRHVGGTHVLFIDDDVVLHPDYLSITKRLLDSTDFSIDQVIVTGGEINDGVRIYPHEQSFLGFQRVPYMRRSSLNTIVINSTLFPRSVFEKIRFDEYLVYGYEEVDLALRAVSLGYRILCCEDALNHHYPSHINRDYYKSHIDASRLYVTFKRYMYLERTPMKAAVYALIGFLHIVAHYTRSRGILGMGDAFKCLLVAIRNVNNYRRTRACDIPVMSGT